MPVFKSWIFDNKRKNKNSDTPSGKDIDSQSEEPSTPTKKNIFFSPKKLIRNSKAGFPITLGRMKEKNTPTYIAADIKPVPEPEFIMEMMEKKHKADLESESQKLRADMLRKLDIEKKQLKEEAYKEGYDEGLESGKSQFRELSEELRHTINAAVTERDQLILNSEPAILQLSVEIAKKIIQTEMTNNPSVFQHILKEAVDKVTDKDKVIIKVNPDDIDFVKEYKETFKKQLSEYKSLEVKSDPEISQGGCVIETNLGYIDSSLSTKLSLIEQALIQTHNETHVD